MLFSHAGTREDCSHELTFLLRRPRRHLGAEVRFLVESNSDRSTMFQAQVCMRPETPCKLSQNHTPMP